MWKRNKVAALIVLLLLAALVLSGCTANALETAKKKKNTSTPVVTVAATVAPTAVPAPTATPGPLEEAQRLADYLFEHGELPENFITKNEAKALGWDPEYKRNNVSDVAPGMSIGGDYFGNYEQKLPAVKGRKYYEADCFYRGGKRNAYRIIYSTDGHVWFTEDHYNTFIELFPTEDGSVKQNE